MRATSFAVVLCSTTLFSACATAREPTAPEQAAAAVQDALPAELLSSAVTPADVSSLFSAFRAALKGEDPAMPPALDKKLEQLADELPARMLPLIDKLLTIAEQEVQKNLPSVLSSPAVAADR